NALPTPKTMDNVRVECNKMQEMFDQSQELRAKTFEKGARERNFTFTINEAKRETKFVEVQQKRKEIFDEAEDSRESEFEEAQQRRESEFWANERKREDEFDKNEMERNDRARKAQENRGRQFQAIMSELLQECRDEEEGRLKELELLGEELITSREKGLPLNHEKFTRRVLGRGEWPLVKRDAYLNERLVENSESLLENSRIRRR
ncbi:hypothetical protein C0993_011860, partial [Termitomyces sp. T159_Od127]